MKSDPYAYADGLINTANDLVSDMTSFTVQDIATILQDVAHYIEHLADEYNSYVARTRITLTVGHEVMDLTEEILPMLNGTLLQQWVHEAITSYIHNGPAHGHTH